MAGAAGHNHQVPDEVMVGYALAGVEDDADGIHHAAHANPEKADGGHVGENLARANHAEPAHRQIERCGENREAVGEPEFEQNAGDGNCPDNAEERPAPTAPQIDEQKWRVGAGDQGIDCAVIEDHQCVFGARRRCAVIKRGSSVEADQRDTINRATDNLPAAAVNQSQHGQDREGHKAAHQAETMGERIGKLFHGDLTGDTAHPAIHIDTMRLCEG